jgi:hypothetical protein
MQGCTTSAEDLARKLSRLWRLKEHHKPFDRYPACGFEDDRSHASDLFAIGCSLFAALCIGLFELELKPARLVNYG